MKNDRTDFHYAVLKVAYKLQMLLAKSDEKLKKIYKKMNYLEEVVDKYTISLIFK